MRAALLFVLAVCACEAPPLHPGLDWAPSERASPGFWDTWGDGNAELASYRGTVTRYGERREAELVLVTVTEPLDRRTLIKDDGAGDPVQVLKLNAMLRFQTGIYPYTVMTSTFAPTDGYFAERFAPARISMSAQEWCGHTWLGAWPGRTETRVHGISYFAEEGERTETLPTEDALFEDALPLMVRELDGPFLGGATHAEVTLVPSLWSSRRDHAPLAPSPATMDRTAGEPFGGEVTTRFTFRYTTGERTIAFDVTSDHRLTRLAENDDVLLLENVVRLPYWQLNHEGDARHRVELGLTEDAFSFAR
jgi:hypothetical protein